MSKKRLTKGPIPAALVVLGLMLAFATNRLAPDSPADASTLWVLGAFSSVVLVVLGLTWSAPRVAPRTHKQLRAAVQKATPENSALEYEDGVSADVGRSLGQRVSDTVVLRAIQAAHRKALPAGGQVCLHATDSILSGFGKLRLAEVAKWSKAWEKGQPVFDGAVLFAAKEGHRPERVQFRIGYHQSVDGTPCLRYSLLSVKPEDPGSNAEPGKATDGTAS